MADWNRSLPESLAARLEPSCRPPRSAAASSLQPTDLLQYLEAMPAARLRLPDAVHFLIGSFPALFGSDLGAKLRSWCVQRGWILLWSLGLNLGPNAQVNYVSDDHSNPHFFYWRAARLTAPFPRALSVDHRIYFGGPSEPRAADRSTHADARGGLQLERARCGGARL